MACDESAGRNGMHVLPVCGCATHGRGFGGVSERVLHVMGQQDALAW